MKRLKTPAVFWAATAVLAAACSTPAPSATLAEAVVWESDSGEVLHRGVSGSTTYLGRSHVEGYTSIASDGSVVSHDDEVLAVSRDGGRVALADAGEIHIKNASGDTLAVASCPDPTAGVWDKSDSILAVVCGDMLLLLGEIPFQSESEARKSLPGRGRDVTRWGEGLALLVEVGGELQLLRTPPHLQDKFGLLAVLPSDTHQISGSAVHEQLLILTSSGRVLDASEPEPYVEVASGVRTFVPAPDPLVLSPPP